MKEAVRIQNSQSSAHISTEQRNRRQCPQHSAAGCFSDTLKNNTADTEQTKADACSVKRLYNEWIFLCVGLCVCFLLLLTSGDTLRSLSQSDGINALSESLRSVISENSSVAVFFGLCDDEEPNEDPSQSVLPQSIPVFNYVQESSREEYIEKHNAENYRISGTLPVFGTVSSGYSFRKNPFWGKYENESEYEFHSGVDIAADHGTEILCYLDGTVEKCALSASYGYYVCVDHGDGLKTLYAHASRLLCNEGDEVKQGQVIATVGDTGRATGAHLHFEVYENGETADPAKYLKMLYADTSEADN